MSRSFNLLRSAIGFVLLFAISTFAQAQTAGMTKAFIILDGIQRTYYLHLPKGHDALTDVPLVIAMHGGSLRSDGLDAAKIMELNKVADQEGFIVAYPNGIDYQWNDGRKKSVRRPGDNTSTDDVGFLSKLMDHLVAEHKANPQRIYAVGYSNGGMMALRLGCERSAKIAAVAAVAAGLAKEVAASCKPDSSLPVLLINGNADPVMPWQGGPVKIFGNDYGEVISADNTVQLWVNLNGCNPTPETQSLPDRDLKDGTTVSSNVYQNSESGCEVIQYVVDGGGHTFPGSPIPNKPSPLGKKNNDIAANQVIWDFFKRHAR